MACPILRQIGAQSLTAKQAAREWSFDKTHAEEDEA